MKIKLSILTALLGLFMLGVAFAGSPQYNVSGYRNGCSGQGTLASGTLQVNADCLANFSLIGISIQPSAAVTPGSITVNAAVTSTSTGSPAATHTVVIFNASTANATPVVNWWGIK